MFSPDELARIRKTAIDQAISAFTRGWNGSGSLDDLDAFPLKLTRDDVSFLRSIHISPH